VVLEGGRRGRGRVPVAIGSTRTTAGRLPATFLPLTPPFCWTYPLLSDEGLFWFCRTCVAIAGADYCVIAADTHSGHEKTRTENRTEVTEPIGFGS
jgi:hypothetical protein